MAEVNIDIAKETSVEVVKDDTAAIKADVTTVKGDTAVIKTNLSVVKGDVSTVKSDVSTVKTNVLTVKTNVADIKSKTDLIGATGDTGGSTTAGTVMGKLNKLISDSGSTSSVPIIKSVQRGNITAATTTLAQSVDPDKCIVLLESRYSGSFAYKNSDGDYVFYKTTATKFVSLTATKLTVELGQYYDDGSRPTAKTNPTTYQIVEFY